MSTEPVPSDSLTTLDALKAKVATFSRDCNNTWCDKESLQRDRAQAWKAAFEWHVGLIKRHAALSEEVGAHITDWIAIDREEEEGMALIREQLK